jgi:hypothetical protein
MMKIAEDQLRKEGVPEKNLQAAAANLVGQADMESGLDPNKVHDNGTGFGIYGARLSRRQKMFNWLASNGYAKNSAEGQMRYMSHEAMSGAYPQTKASLMSGAYGADTTNRITREFESPAVVNARFGAVEQARRAETGAARPTSPDEQRKRDAEKVRRTLTPNPAAGDFSHDFASHNRYNEHPKKDSTHTKVTVNHAPGNDPHTSAAAMAGNGQ